MLYCVRPSPSYSPSTAMHTLLTSAQLWSLLNFLLPDIFDDWESFQAWFEFTDDLLQSASASTPYEQETFNGA